MLERPGVLRAFNLTMAGLLVASLYPLALEAWRAHERVAYGIVGAMYFAVCFPLYLLSRRLEVRFHADG